MPTVDDILRDLLDLNKMLYDCNRDQCWQSAILASIESESLLQIAKTISSLQGMDYGTSTRILDVIDQCQFSTEHKKHITHIVQETMKTRQQIQSKCWQRHLYLQSYLTHGEWRVIDTVGSTLVSKLEVMTARLISLGILYCHERTAQAVVAIIVRQMHHAGLQISNTANLYTMLQQFHRKFESASHAGFFSHICQYPENPRDLPPALYARAYPCRDQQPVMKDAMFDKIFVC